MPKREAVAGGVDVVDHARQLVRRGSARRAARGRTPRAPARRSIRSRRRRERRSGRAVPRGTRRARDELRRLLQPRDVRLEPRCARRVDDRSDVGGEPRRVAHGELAPSRPRASRSTRSAISSCRTEHAQRRAALPGAVEGRGRARRRRPAPAAPRSRRPSRSARPSRRSSGTLPRAASVRWMISATSVEPVNTTPSTRGSADEARADGLARAGQQLQRGAPGTPASRKQAHRLGRDERRLLRGLRDAPRCRRRARPRPGRGRSRAGSSTG